MSEPEQQPDPRIEGMILLMYLFGPAVLAIAIMALWEYTR